MTSLLARIHPRQNLDLLGLLVLALVVGPLLPLDHWVSRDDLIPWTTATLVGIALLRASTLGHAPPPSLRPRAGRFTARRAAWIAPALVPVTLLLWYDTARELLSALVLGQWLGDTLVHLGLAAAFTTGLVVTARLAHSHLVTAWQPTGLPDWLVWAGRGVGVVTAALTLGALHGALSALLVYRPELREGWQNLLTEPAVWVPISGLLGLQFFAIGLLCDRPLVHRQRRASGRRDRRPYTPPRFRYFLAFAGPSVGLFLLALLHTLLPIGPLSYSQSLLVSLHVLAWALVIWPRPTPVAVSCILHEVIPAGGKDPIPDTSALPFDQPPRGALRLNPMSIRRLRVLHHWVVRVKDARLENLDDPIRPLWPPTPPPVPFHVLGLAAFEPDARTQLAQWREITVRLSPQTDIGRLGEDTAQQRRMVVLRAFPEVGGGLFAAQRTYRWEHKVAASSIQVVDATTESLTLRNGDVIVLSTEGVARAYELEIGAPLYDRSALGVQRPAQLEDYVRVG